jgi:hypothetical protein
MEGNLNFKVEFKGIGIKGSTEIHIPTFFGINLAGCSNLYDIAHEAEKELTLKYGKPILVTKVKKIG